MLLICWYQCIISRQNHIEFWISRHSFICLKQTFNKNYLGKLCFGKRLLCISSLTKIKILPLLQSLSKMYGIQEPYTANYGIQYQPQFCLVATKIINVLKLILLACKKLWKSNLYIYPIENYSKTSVAKLNFCKTNFHKFEPKYFVLHQSLDFKEKLGNHEYLNPVKY